MISAGLSPRVRGNGCSRTGVVSIRGLSPRVRGNRWTKTENARDEGSISARAGKPLRTCRHTAYRRVYPRLCGGEDRSSYAACSGRVYPRPCGGSKSVNASVWKCWGLSPRVRGKPELHRGGVGCHWTILARAGKLVLVGLILLELGTTPARAGEPVPGFGWMRTTWAYPRVCGGTENLQDIVSRNKGLSPQVRRNRWESGTQVCACRDYPRVFGEPSGRFARTRHKGACPHSCGKCVNGCGHFVHVRSIPAHAGEPTAECRARVPL